MSLNKVKVIKTLYNQIIVEFFLKYSDKVKIT